MGPVNLDIGPPRGTPEIEMVSARQRSLARGPAKAVLTRSSRTLVAMRAINSMGSMGSTRRSFPFGFAAGVAGWPSNDDADSPGVVVDIDGAAGCCCEWDGIDSSA